ncbi:equilibrative nucleobase transporter 1-like isoform X2 [Biomphalaria glabrata]|uniref:Equilibrative nucleobase transporter 1-like isoform X2 n=1 Tax=Biomphalaria glabrata TaxID=6526 RepID=A0A9U8DV18_BIOGL|nr:equilibrative nucleobase transporter 1-like isoform X2 [Biomphalaria glabrata]
MGASKQRKLRFLYVAWAFCESFGFGGLVFGWGSFVYVLKDEGLYAELCNNGTSNSTHNGSLNEDCPDRDSRLELVFTIGSTCAGIGSFVLGQISFYFGMRVARIVASLCFMCGAYIIAFTTNDLPWLIFPGMALVAFGGISLIMTNVQLSNMFPVGGGAVVGIISGAFDSSSGIQLMVKLGYEQGISRKTSYLILASTHVLTFVSTFLFLPKDYVHPVQEEYVVTQEIELEIPEKPGSINRILEKELENKKEVSDYTNVMLYVLMGGIVASPLAGAFLELNISLFKNSKSSFSRSVKPNIMSLTLTSALGVVLSVLLLLEDPSHLYYIFVFLVLYRSIFYTMVNAYIVLAFPSAFIGSLIGITTITSGVFCLLQHALFEWSARRNAKEVNIFLIVLIGISCIHPFWQWIACRRAEQRESTKE